MSEERAARIGRLPQRARENLALQKEALTASLAIAGIDTSDVLEWSPPDAGSGSFLDGLPEAEVREDTMLIADLGEVPGFHLEGQTRVASKVFVRPGDGMRLTVLMANRTPLEEQLGCDLIYYNEQYKAFVFVQYKAMRKESARTVFRWQADVSDDLVKEIARMDATLAELEKLGDDGTKESFRLHTNPFFLKLCPKIGFDPNDRGLFKGMYIPLSYWKRFETDSASAGPKGGRYASFDNIGRKLNNSEFIPLVAGAWVGTTIPQSAILAKLIREVLASGRTVTFAVQGKVAAVGEGIFEEEYDPTVGLWDDDADEDGELA